MFDFVLEAGNFINRNDNKKKTTACNPIPYIVGFPDASIVLSLTFFARKSVAIYTPGNDKSVNNKAPDNA